MLCPGSNERQIPFDALLHCSCCVFVAQGSRGVEQAVPEHEIQARLARRPTLDDIRRGKQEMHYTLRVESFHAICPCGSRAANVILSNPRLPVHGLCDACYGHLILPEVKLDALESVLVQGLTQLRRSRGDVAPNLGAFGASIQESQEKTIQASAPSVSECPRGQHHGEEPILSASPAAPHRMPPYPPTVRTAGGGESSSLRVVR